MSRLSDEQIIIVMNQSKGVIDTFDNNILQVCRDVCDAQLEALPKEMKLISDEDFLKIDAPTHEEIDAYLITNLTPISGKAIMSAFTILYAQKAMKLQLAADLLVPDEKRAELEDFIFSIQTDVLSLLTKDSYETLYKRAQQLLDKINNHLQEKGQTK